MIHALHTKEQMIRILTAWKVDTSLPKKGETKYVTWPKPTQPNTAEIKKTDKKGTYVGVLYSIEFKNR